MVNINSSKDPSYFVCSDASATGGGAIIDFYNDFVCHKMWSENERVQSLTWRELSVIEFSLQSFASVLKGSHVKWFTDSQAAAKIVERAVGTLVVPLWPSAHFWPLITHKYSSYLVAHSIHIGNEVILSSNSWKGFQQFSSINVYEVLEVMLKSRGDTTTKAYVRVIRKFLEWSKVQQSCTSSSSVILAHAALKWLHSFVPSLDRNPLDSEFCRNIIESAKRQKSQPVMKKKPITTEIIRSILDIHNKKDANLKNLRIAALCSLAFAGFFRYDELCNIVPKHIEFHSDYIRIFVPRSKTDVYREGNFVFISASRSKYCPVGVLQRYLDLSGIDLCSSLPLFRPLVFHR
ncbi:unnamed protein product, partial [Porites lobata]